MRKSILVAAGAVVGSFLSVSAWAFPTAPVHSNTDLVLVAEGCGPGFHRGLFGICHPNERVCGRGWHYSVFWGRCVRNLFE